MNTQIKNEIETELALKKAELQIAIDNYKQSVDDSAFGSAQNWMPVMQGLLDKCSRYQLALNNPTEENLDNTGLW